MAKFVPAGSDLVVQIHYATNGRPARDQTAVIKMVIVDFYHVPILVSLGVIVVTLAVAISASLIYPKPKPVAAEQHPKTGSIFGSVFPEDRSREDGGPRAN